MPDAIIWIIGAALLIAGGGALTRGALGFAAGAGVPARVAAATIVAFGASAPEVGAAMGLVRDGLAASVPAMTASANLANIALVLGLAALIAPAPTVGAGVRRGALVAAFTAILLAAWALSGVSAGLMAGLAALAACAVHVWLQERAAASGDPDPEAVDHHDIYALERAPRSWGASAGLAAFGIGLLIAGSLIGVPAAVALGGPDPAGPGPWLGLAATAPELGAALAAALTGRLAIAVPAAFSGVIFNGLAVTGLALLFAPTAVPDGRSETLVLAGACVVLAFAARTLLKAPVGRFEGALYLAGFVAILVLSG